MSAVLILAVLGLLAAILAQDWAIPALRARPISDGFEGHLHGWLDGASLALAGALWAATEGQGITHALAIATALALILCAATATLHTAVDRLTGGRHALAHTTATGAVFAAAFATQVSADHGALWGLTAANLAAPTAIWALSRRDDYAEKLGVLVLSVWLIVWALTG